MSAYDGPLPCAGRWEVYDVVLHPRPGTPSAVRREALVEAGRLCARCPARCSEAIAYRPAPTKQAART